MADNTTNVEQKAEEVESKVRAGVQEGAKKVDEALDGRSEDVAKATQRAEDEVNKLKAELAELRRNVGPKIQEAEHFLTSSTAITFYKGVITGVALILAFKKYAEKR